MNAGAEGCFDVFAGKCDCGQAAEASGGGVAEDGFAGFGVVLAAEELADWGAGEDEEVEVLEEG